jgi:hypothetical protein
LGSVPCNWGKYHLKKPTFHNLFYRKFLLEFLLTRFFHSEQQARCFLSSLFFFSLLKLNQTHFFQLSFNKEHIPAQNRKKQESEQDEEEIPTIQTMKRIESTTERTKITTITTKSTSSLTFFVTLLVKIMAVLSFGCQFMVFFDMTS